MQNYISVVLSDAVDMEACPGILSMDALAHLHVIFEAGVAPVGKRLPGC